jgi:hypothetical protein
MTRHQPKDELELGLSATCKAILVCTFPWPTQIAPEQQPLPSCQKWLPACGKLSVELACLPRRYLIF